MNQTKEAFGVKVRKKLIDLDMSQKELAAHVGINEKYLWQILHGRRSHKKYETEITEALLEKEKIIMLMEEAI